MSVSFRYPWRALAADYARSAAGLAVAVLLAWVVHPAAAVSWIMGGCAALFLVYFGRTVCRHLTHIELDEAGVCARGPLGAAIRWESLCSVRLEYYSTRRDQEEGWMQLKLRGARRTICIDSDLAGFAELTRAAAARARQCGLDVDESTRSNLSALGG